MSSIWTALHTSCCFFSFFATSAFNLLGCTLNIHTLSSVCPHDQRNPSFLLCKFMVLAKFLERNKPSSQKFFKEQHEKGLTHRNNDAWHKLKLQA